MVRVAGVLIGRSTSAIPAMPEVNIYPPSLHHLTRDNRLKDR